MTIFINKNYFQTKFVLIMLLLTLNFVLQILIRYFEHVDYWKSFSQVAHRGVGFLHLGYRVDSAQYLHKYVYIYNTKKTDIRKFYKSFNVLHVSSEQYIANSNFSYIESQKITL